LSNALILSEEQEEAVDYLYSCDYALLLAGTGVGKTIITLTTIRDLIKDKHLNKVIVACPAKVVSGWAKEVDKWGFDLKLYAGTGEKFLASIPLDYDVIVTSYESLPKLLNTKHAADGIVFDEVTRLKETGGKIARSVNRHIKAFKWRIGLSATPLSESWESVYGITKVLDLGERFGKNKERFYMTYFNQLDYKGYKFAVKPEKIDEITQKFYEFTYIIGDESKRDKIKEPIQLPDKVISLATEIEDLQNELINDEIIIDGDSVVISTNAAVLSGKLRQLSQGFVYYNDGSVKWVSDYRVRVFIELIKDKLKNGAVVATYEYSPILDKVSELIDIPFDVINGSTTKDAFNKTIKKWRVGRGKLLLLQVRAGSHGLDGLQMSSYQMLHFAPIWSRDATIQLEGRLDRTGQTQQVEIQTIMVEGSIDYSVKNRVIDKGNIFTDFINRIRG